MPDGVSRETSARIDRLFGAQRAIAEQYVAWLADQGVVRGLLGPREAPRLWERHVLNCAVVASLVPAGASVRDIGSGAGLPGIPLAVARPDLQMELVEPLLRRATFLSETCDRLGLDRVTVTRARAEDLRDMPTTEVVTARAVAPVARLLGWCLPLVSPGGSLLALKGARVHEELAEAGDLLPSLGAASWRVDEVGGELLDEPTTVLVVERAAVRSGRPVQAPETRTPPRRPNSAGHRTTEGRREQP